MAETIEPTPEDWENVHRSLENPRQHFMETLARLEPASESSASDRNGGGEASSAASSSAIGSSG